MFCRACFIGQFSPIMPDIPQKELGFNFEKRVFSFFYHKDGPKQNIGLRSGTGVGKRKLVW